LYDTRTSIDYVTLRNKIKDTVRANPCDIRCRRYI